MYDLNDITVIDNFIGDEDFNVLKELVFDLKWKMGEILPNYVYKDHPDIQNYYNIHFNHLFYVDANPPNREPGITSDAFKLLYPLVKKINPKYLIKIKANIGFNHGKHVSSYMHTDPGTLGESMTGVYYLNTCNGYTEFENGTKVESVENRMVIFPNEFYHCGVTATDSKYRAVLNLNWYDEKRLKTELKGQDLYRGNIKKHF